MRAWSAVLIVSLALFAPSSSYGRGGISRGGHSSGFSGGFSGGGSYGSNSGGSVHVRSYTRRDGTQVGSYNRSAPGTASDKTASSKSTRSSSSGSTKSLADEAFGPVLTPPSSLVSHGSISGSTGASSTTNTKSNAASLPSANTTNSSNANQAANQTAASNLQFLGGYPVLGLALSSGYLNPDTAAQRQYSGLVSNARNLIRAGIYPEAAALLQRVINNVPGTRIAGVAQQLLSRIPIQ
jgi:hypothetical protein